MQTWFVAVGLIAGAIGVLGFFAPALVNIEENRNVPAAAETTG